ncbi:MAG: class I SAM-dependent methyltransferase [Anaerolineae bacterium]
MTNRAQLIAENLAPHLSPNQTLLEIGAGKGHVAQALREAASVEMHLVDVVDYNETALPLRVYDGARLPFADRTFDYSLLIFVLHHTPDPLVVLREALRVSRGGVLIVENHVPGWARQQITRLIDSIPHWQHGVPICYRAQTMTAWEQTFQQLPTRVQRLGRFNMGAFWDNFVVRVEGAEGETGRQEDR